MKKSWIWLGGGLAALALAGWGWSNKRFFTTNDITTGESAAYPELRSHVYYAEPAQALSAGAKAIAHLPRWRLVSEDAENAALEAEVRTPIGPFTDDVTVYVQPLGHSQSRVVIRSRARVGRGDFGQNAVHIRQLQRAMDDRLNANRAF